MSPRPALRLLSRRSISTQNLRAIHKHLLELEKQPAQPADRRALLENIRRVAARIKRRSSRKKPAV